MLDSQHEYTLLIAIHPYYSVRLVDSKTLTYTRVENEGVFLLMYIGQVQLTSDAIPDVQIVLCPDGAIRYDTIPYDLKIVK